MNQLLSLSEIRKTYPKLFVALILVALAQLSSPFLYGQYFQFIEKPSMKSIADSQYLIFEYGQYASDFKKYVPHEYDFAVVDKTNKNSITETYWYKNGSYKQIISKNGKWKKTSESDRTLSLTFKFSQLGMYLAFVGLILYIIRLIKSGKISLLFAVPEFKALEGYFVLCSIVLWLTGFGALILKVVL